MPVFNDIESLLPLTEGQILSDLSEVEKILSVGSARMIEPRKIYVKSHINEFLDAPDEGVFQQFLIYIKGKKKPALLLIFD